MEIIRYQKNILIFNLKINYMNTKLFFLLLTFFTFKSVRSQELVYINHNIDFSKLKNYDAIVDESEEKKIKSDKILVYLALNEDCTIAEFKILRKGILESFNRAIENGSEYIFGEFLKKISCTGKKMSYTLPLKISFY